MSEPVLGSLLIGLMFVLFALGVEISISLGIVGVLGLLWLKGFTVGLGVVGSIAWSNASSFSFIDRKSTRLNSSHGYISYAVFCLKKKNNKRGHTTERENQNYELKRRRTARLR